VTVSCPSFFFLFCQTFADAATLSPPLFFLLPRSFVIRRTCGRGTFGIFRLSFIPDLSRMLATPVFCIFDLQSARGLVFKRPIAHAKFSPPTRFLVVNVEATPPNSPAPVLSLLKCAQRVTFLFLRESPPSCRPIWPFIHPLLLSGPQPLSPGLAEQPAAFCGFG